MTLKIVEPLFRLFPPAPEPPPEPPIGQKWHDGGVVGEQRSEDILARVPLPGERVIAKSSTLGEEYERSIRDKLREDANRPYEELVRDFEGTRK